MRRIPAILAALVLLVWGLAGCGPEKDPALVVTDRDVYTFADGKSVSIGSYPGDGKRIYHLDDGTELLAVESSPGLEDAIAGGVEPLQALEPAVREKIAGFYARQGALYDVEALLLDAYAGYNADPAGFSCRLAGQRTAPSASSGRVIYCTTAVTLPLGGRETGEYGFTQAFDRQTGDPVAGAELFSAEETDVKERFLAQYPADGAVPEVLREDFRPEYIRLSPEGYEVTFPPETSGRAGVEGCIRFGGPYTGELLSLLNDWAVPVPYDPEGTGETGRAELPWTVPEEEPAPSYEEYFAQVVDYGHPDGEECRVSSGYNISGYTLAYEDPALYLERYVGDGKERLWKIADIPELSAFSCDQRWIYGIAGGTELFRMDFYGENRETLFTDESGLLGETAERTFFIGDGKVIYFWTGTEDGGGAVCRLYLPEKRADLLYRLTAEELAEYYYTPQTEEVAEHWGGTGKVCLLGAPGPISNWEFSWSSINGAYLEACDAVAQDPELREKYFTEGVNGVDLVGYIEFELHIKSFTVYYLNAFTGEYLERPMGGYSVPGGAWWRQEQNGDES